MRKRIYTLDLESDYTNPREDLDTTWLVDETMEGGPWVIGGNASQQDRSKLLIDFARAAAIGAPLLGSKAPKRQVVRYVNFSKSEAAARQDLEKAGLTMDESTNVFDPRLTGANTFNWMSRQIMPNGGLILVDGITASLFGGRSEIMEFLEISLASAAPNLNIIVSLPEGLANATSVRYREDRFLGYSNLLWLLSDKGQLNLEVRAHDASDSRFFSVGDKWLPTAGRNSLNPTEAAILNFLSGQKTLQSNGEIYLAVEPSSGATAKGTDADRVPDRFQKVLQRMCSDGAICRDPQKDGYYYDPLNPPDDLNPTPKSDDPPTEPKTADEEKGDHEAPFNNEDGSEAEDNTTEVDSHVSELGQAVT